MPSPKRISALDFAPNLIAMALTMVSVLVVPHIGPQRLVVDQVRFYVTVAVASLLTMIVIGAVAVRTMGSRRE